VCNCRGLDLAANVEKLVKGLVVGSTVRLATLRICRQPPKRLPEFEAQGWTPVRAEGRRPRYDKTERGAHAVEATPSRSGFLICRRLRPTPTSIRLTCCNSSSARRREIQEAARRQK